MEQKWRTKEQRGEEKEGGGRGNNLNSAGDLLASLAAQTVKRLPTMRETRV